MKKRVYPIIAVVSDALAVSGCVTNPYIGGREVGKSVIGAGLGPFVDTGIGALSSPKKDRGKGALIDAIAGTALGGGVGYYMDMQEAKLRDKMCGTDVSVTRSGGNIILDMSGNMTFSSSSTILKLAGASTLTGMMMVLKEYPKAMVNVIGHTGSMGGHDLSMRLSQQRTDSVINALTTQGMNASRVRIQGLNPANPIAGNSTAEGKA